MIKILIWDLNYMLKNSGGASGYLYNIREHINNNVTIDYYKNLFFLKDLLGIPNVDISMNTKHKSLMSFIHKIDFINLVGYYRAFRCYNEWNKQTSFEIIEKIDLNLYDVIHFHHPGDLYRASGLLKNYRGKIVLTSHSPQPYSYEASENISYKKSIIRLFLKKRLLNREIEAWKIANYLMFPVKEALEPYIIDDKIKLFIRD